MINGYFDLIPTNNWFMGRLMKVKHGIILFTLFLFPFLHLIGATFQYENLLIDKVRVTYNGPCGQNFDERLIKNRIKTKEGDFFSQNDFDTDLKTLAQDYDRVDPEFSIVDDKIQIHLKIWPRPTIRTITWYGNDRIETPKLQKELGISLCSVFDRLAFNKAFHKLKAFYIKKGFFEAELNYNIAYDSSTNEVDISIDIKEGRSGRIKNIVFCNFTACEEDLLLEMMVTKKFNIFTSWLNNEGTYNEDAVNHDQFIILNYLQNLGYADAKVTIDVCECKQNNRIELLITADRGELYSCGKLTFEGNTLFTDEEIAEQFAICEGEPFSPEKIRETQGNITDFYGRRGFIDTNVNYEPRLDPLCHSYSVHFTIDEGEQFRVGLIKVFGNCSTQTNVILHETLLVPGEVFNTDKLKRTEERLKNIGYFSQVNVYSVQSEAPCGPEGNYRDVHIEVEETSTGRFGTFFGYSTVETLFGGLNVTEKNFNSAGIRNLFSRGYPALRGGGEYAHITVTIGHKSRSYVLSWTKPYFMDSQWSVGFDAEKSNNRYISNDYSIDACGYTLHANRDINAFVRFGWHYRIRHTFVDISNKTAVHDPGLNRAARIHGLISASGFSLSYDSTGDIEMPKNGFKSRFEIEYAGMGGDHRFWGLAYLNSYYIPVGSCGVLKLRGDLRFLDPITPTKFHSMPLDERLFLGGDSTIRGYHSYRLGPRFKDGDPKGGISMQLLSIEYNRTLFKRMDGFLFCDSGHLSDHRWHFGRLSTAIGFGARIKVLDCFPKIELGMGFPINAAHRSQVRRFFISFGGRF